jgi:hypothetical protein
LWSEGTKGLLRQTKLDVQAGKQVHILQAGEKICGCEIEARRWSSPQGVDIAEEGVYAEYLVEVKTLEEGLGWASAEQARDIVEPRRIGWTDWRYGPGCGWRGWL